MISLRCKYMEKKNILRFIIFALFIFSIVSVSAAADSWIDTFINTAQLTAIFSKAAADQVKAGEGNIYIFFKLLLFIIYFSIIWIGLTKFLKDQKNAAIGIGASLAIGAAILTPASWVYALFFGFISGLLSAVLLFAAILINHHSKKLSAGFKGAAKVILGFCLIYFATAAFLTLALLGSALAGGAVDDGTFYGLNTTPTEPLTGTFLGFVQYAFVAVGWILVIWGILQFVSGIFGGEEIVKDATAVGTTVSGVGGPLVNWISKRFGQDPESRKEAEIFGHHNKFLRKTLGDLNSLLEGPNGLIKIIENYEKGGFTDADNGKQLIKRAREVNVQRELVSEAIKEYHTDLTKFGGKLKSSWAKGAIVDQTALVALQNRDHRIVKLVQDSEVLHMRLDILIANRAIFEVVIIDLKSIIINSTPADNFLIDLHNRLIKLQTTVKTLNP